MAITILLIDDNVHDNFFHERIIKKTIDDVTVIVYQKALDALEFLKDKSNDFPKYIFLDINMPGLNGWEFIEKFNQYFSNNTQQCNIYMLSTSNNPDDIRKAKSTQLLNGFVTKPLTIEKLQQILV